MTVKDGLLNGMKIHWRGILTILWPLLCLNVFFLGTDPKIRCAYVILIMAFFWVTEVLPLAITSMIPMFAWPVFNVLNTSDTTKEYFSPTNIMFFAGLVVANSLEYSKLHTRIAYRTILIIGTTHRRLSFAIAVITAFLSYWVNNTAATAMVGAIIKAILIELQSQKMIRYYEDGSDPNEDSQDERFSTKTTSFYFLMACMSATIGGIGTIIGTGTNLACKGLLETRFPDMPALNFTEWAAMGVPFTIINVAFLWFWFNFIFMGLGHNYGMDPEILDSKKNNRSAEENTLIKGVVNKKVEESGPINWHQIATLIIFIIVALLWILRNPGFMPGWSLITPLKVDDASAGIFAIFLMFLVPSTCYFWSSFDPNPEKWPEDDGHVTGVMIWKYISTHMPWDMLFLLGGGFAIAKGAKECGLTYDLGQTLKVLEVIPPFGIMACVTLFANIITELTSNVAICNLILPVVMELSVALKVHPLYFSVPVAWNCSFAYLLPVGTPANLVAKGFCNFPQKHMLKVGAGIKLFSYITSIIITETIGRVLYNFESFPEWAV